MKQHSHPANIASMVLLGAVMIGTAILPKACEVVSKEEAHSSKQGHWGPQPPRPRGVDKK